MPIAGVSHTQPAIASLQNPLSAGPAQNATSPSSSITANSPDSQHEYGQSQGAGGRGKSSAPGAVNYSLNGSKTELTAQEAAVLLELKKTDQQVRQHEAAHIAAGGSYVSKAASYSYRVGPDGNRYAVAGEVGIDVSPERDPRVTVQKMAVVQRAALAPADPSPQDRAVAAKAAMMSAQAQAQIVRLQYEKNKGLPSVWSASPGMTIDRYA